MRSIFGGNWETVKASTEGRAQQSICMQHISLAHHSAVVDHKCDRIVSTVFILVANEERIWFEGEKAMNLVGVMTWYKHEIPSSPFFNTKRLND